MNFEKAVNVIKTASIIPLMAIAIPSVAYADEVQEEAQEEAEVGLWSDHQYRELILTTESAKSSNAAPRTRALTGIEYEHIDNENQPNEELLHYIYADGFTRVTDNFSMGYVFKEIHHSRGGESTGQSNYSEIIPSFYWRQNDNVAYNLMLSYEKTIGEWHYDKYMAKPGIDLSFGRHFLHLSAELGYKDERQGPGSRGAFIESEPLYLYRLDNGINIGAKVIYVEEHNDFNYVEFAVKPLVQFNFDNGNYLELRYERGTLDMGSDPNNRDHFDYDVYALYADLPINEHFSFLADIQVKDRHADPAPWTGDQLVWFSKVGIVWKF